MIDATLGTTSQPTTRDWRDRPHFTASHRALTVCLREVQWVSDEITKRLRALHAAGELPALVVAQSPGRCMAQLGPVALTMAWLRGGLDVVADGQLMIVVWEGAVLHGTRRIPERAPVLKAASAKMLWEESYGVVAESEASWRWHSADDVADRTSMALVDHCIEQLLAAHARVDAARVA